MTVTPYSEIIDRTAQYIHAALMEENVLRVGGGQSLQKNADELLHVFLFLLGLGKET
jgi:hypothetical protein